MIQLDIDLLQLNDLYYAVAKHTKDCAEQIKEYGQSEYFERQLERAQELEDKVQQALHDRVYEMQEAIDYIDEVVEKYENETEDEPTQTVRIHIVSNEEADEDAYTDYEPNKQTNNFGNDRNGVSQFILDFVEANGVVSYTEMNDLYKAYTKGSNSFSHILKALMIPYKNRPTQRYITQTGYGRYMVRRAHPGNWVVKH